MREHFQLVMNKLLNVSDLTNGTFNFVREVSSSPAPKFVCLLDLSALLMHFTNTIDCPRRWLLSNAASIIYFHRHERQKHMLADG